MDKELQMEAELYRSELETEWLQISPMLMKNTEMFPGATKQLF